MSHVIRDFIGSLAEGSQVIDHDLRFRAVAGAASGLLGRTLAERFPGVEGSPVYAALVRCLHERAPQRLETELPVTNGPSRWLQLHFVPVPDGVCSVAIDITEQKRLTDQLRSSLQLEAVGRVAGGIAHDINNVLSVILSYSEMIREELDNEDAARADVDEIRTAGMRAADLTRQLLAFGTQPMAIPRAVDLGALVASAEKPLKRILGATIEVSRVSSAMCWPVRVDPGQLEHVLLRLAMHARQTMPAGGKLVIETRNVELAAGPHVALAFTSRAIGLGPEGASQVLDPVHEIVEQAGGFVEHEVVPGEGTTLRICLPRVREAGEYHPVTVPPFAVPAGGTILLVEEDPQLNALVAGILRRAGYNVLTSTNAGEALLICEQEVGRIDLLLTDVVLPRMNGQRLAQRLGPLHPEMRVVYMAGYTDDAGLVHDVRASGVALLEKPITPAALLRQVRRSLAQRSSTITI